MLLLLVEAKRIIIFTSDFNEYSGLHQFLATYDFGISSSEVEVYHVATFSEIDFILN